MTGMRSRPRPSEPQFKETSGEFTERTEAGGPPGERGRFARPAVVAEHRQRENDWQEKLTEIKRVADALAG